VCVIISKIRASKGLIAARSWQKSSAAREKQLHAAIWCEFGLSLGKSSSMTNNGASADQSLILFD
jgi:hypothetical protein